MKRVARWMSFIAGSVILLTSSNGYVESSTMEKMRRSGHFALATSAIQSCVRSYPVLGVGLLAWLSSAGGVAWADRVINVDTTISNGTLTVDPPSGLIVSHATNNPLLTVTNFSDSDGVEGVVVGSLSGESGRMLIGPQSYIGNGGAGTLGTYGSISVRRGAGYIGLNSGAVGHVTVSGPAAIFGNADSLFVGYGGTGTLILENGGGAFSQSGNIGFQPGSIGEVRVSGSGSSWSMLGSLLVGIDGQGSLTISGGGSVYNLFGFVGFYETLGVVTVTGLGSTWTNAQYFEVGPGILTIENSGRVETIDGYVGVIPSTDPGMVKVTGTGSVLHSSGQLQVGTWGAGTVIIENGGDVSSDAGAILGVQTGSSGQVFISGTGSQWTLGSTLQVGERGGGAVVVENGGYLGSLGAVVGGQNGSTGLVMVSGTGSTWLNLGIVTVGSPTDGGALVTIENGGSAWATQVEIGATNAPGLAFVRGEQAIWEAGNTFIVGRWGDGQLGVGAGGTVKTSSFILGWPSGHGMVLVSGAGSKVEASSLIIGQAGSTDEGTGHLMLHEGGQVLVEGDMRTGSREGNVLEFVLSGTDADGYGRLSVGGDIILNSLIFRITLANYDPAFGDSFDLFDYGGELTGTFSSLDLPVLGSGLNWDTSALYSEGIVSVVPEPSTGMLMLLGGFALGRRRRR